MKENDNNKRSVLVGEADPKKNMDSNTGNKTERLKKPLIFALMTIVFAGCMYLIFIPSEKNKKPEDTGLNGLVPQATGTGLQPDKQKAYEQAFLEQKKQEEKKALMSLSDYWNSDSAQAEDQEKAIDDSEEVDGEHEHENDHPRKSTPALRSYRDAQRELNAFYEEDHSETNELRKEIEELKEQLSEKETTPAPSAIDDQFALMEKSYQMAAKYLPSTNGSPVNNHQVKSDSITTVSKQKAGFTPFVPVGKNAVSSLYRELSDSAFIEQSNIARQSFYTAGVIEKPVQLKNSIRASVQETRMIKGEGYVKLRLLEAARTAGQIIPQGSVLTANAMFQGGRLELKITSVELEGNIIPVDITVYDLDGQPGLFVPNSVEMNALSEIAANMSQTAGAGTSIMLTGSATQQLAGDLGRGVVQGVSGYFAKKIKMPKVTVKAGYQVLLLSKK